MMSSIVSSPALIVLSRMRRTLFGLPLFQSLVVEFVVACYHSEVIRLPVSCQKKVRATLRTSHCMDPWDRFFQEHISFSGKMNYVAGTCPSVYNRNLWNSFSVPFPHPYWSSPPFPHFFWTLSSSCPFYLLIFPHLSCCYFYDYWLHANCSSLVSLL